LLLSASAEPIPFTETKILLFVDCGVIVAVNPVVVKDVDVVDVELIVP
jgi:hypothetical protein